MDLNTHLTGLPDVIVQQVTLILGFLTILTQIVLQGEKKTLLKLHIIRPFTQDYSELGLG